MFTLRPHPVRLLVLCWLALAASSTATAKKPPPPPDDPPPPAPVEYAVIWLDGTAKDVNVDGTIVGKQEGRAVCWRFETGWQLEDLNDLVTVPEGDRLETAVCINNAGLIAGRYLDADAAGRHVYVCDPANDNLWVVSYDGPMAVFDVNLHGTVVGRVYPESRVQQGFVWHHDKGFLLLPEHYIVYGITDSDTIVGLITNNKQTAGEVFRWQLDWDYNIEDLPLVERLGATALTYYGRVAINNNGTIAATVTVEGTWAPRRLPLGGIWEPLWGDEESDYGSSYVFDINDAGQISGTLAGRRPKDPDPGFVYVWDVATQEGQFWPMDDRIVRDDSGLWTGMGLPGGHGSAVADESPITSYDGFSMIVTGSCVLVPGPPPQPPPQ